MTQKEQKKPFSEWEGPEKVMHHLNKYGSITHQIADRTYGVARLASVIHRFRKKGIEIETVN